MKTRRHTTDSRITSSHNEGINTSPSTSSDQQSTETSPTQDVIQNVPKSDVWQYFERCTSTGPLKARCLLCQHELSTPNYGTSTLKRHLVQVHGIKQFDSADAPSFSTTSIKLSKSEKKALDLLAVNAIIQDGRGYGDFQKTGIKKLIDALKPDGEEGIEIGTMEDDEDEAQISLNQMVRTMSFDTVSLSNEITNDDSESDGTSKEGDDVNGELESNDQLIDATSDEEWMDEEDDDEATDNFIEGINTEETLLDYIPQMVKDTIDKTREIVNTIKGSSILTSFIEKQRLNFNVRVNKKNKIKRRLVIDVRTRWNSTYKMLHTVNLYRDFINDMFKSKGSLDLSAKQRRKLTRVELSSDEWDLLNLIISLLHPFYSATKVLSNTKYPTVGSALYLMKSLEEHLTKEDNNEILNALKQIVLNKFQQYIIDDVEQFNTLKLYSYFDPTGFSALTRVEQTIIEKDITKLYKNLFLSSETSSSSSNQQTKKITNIDKAWQGFLRSTNKDLLQEPIATSTIQSDIKRYRNLATK
ncbi:unnamed protein product [Rotaria sordida]|uniref:BED-type domain-containing protein n=1 Tax=Rotaria sordida TaxID=392033 RepID=A0A815DF51_9BILA|nr:unnamed protein product [Rotaria sordida]CAF3910938.1 unnamed protein product [Rotaria sordida]